jgi:hypothetical protein
MKAGTKAGTEAEREWAALAIAALFTALAGVAVSTLRDPWYLTVGIVTAFGVFLVAGAMVVVRSVTRHRHPSDRLCTETRPRTKT